MRRAVPALILLLLSACGGDDGGLDRTDATAVFKHAIAAVHDGDWAALKSVVTKGCREKLERELAGIKRRVGHDVDGTFEREVAKARIGATWREEVRLVVEGGPAAAFRFYSLVAPRLREPEIRGMQIKPLERKILFLGAGEQAPIREARLILVHDEWFVHELPL